MTEKELRSAVCAQALSWLGCHESDGSHKVIIDLYNKYKPPAEYTMRYVDAWCAAFSSAVGMAVCVANALPCKPYELIPASAACDPKISEYIRRGTWIEDDAYLPTPGDEIFYDWQDSGDGDNTGSSDHVGIAVAVDGNTITVIEGNKSDSVSYRTIRRGGQYIRGYGIPDYAKYAARVPQQGEVAIIVDEPVNGTGGNAADSAVPGTHNSHSADGGENGTSGRPGMLPTEGLPILRRGDGVSNPSEIVRAAQLLLIGRGFRCGPWGADGEFGSATYGAVYQFQRARGLATDGEIGPMTWARLLGI